MGPGMIHMAPQQPQALVCTLAASAELPPGTATGFDSPNPCLSQNVETMCVQSSADSGDAIMMLQPLPL
jgi:hypothetical protein